MASNKLNSFVKDIANNKVVVTHYCDADVQFTWNMWTKPELLDLWWAPKPWKSETKSMDFRNGGRRIYAMVGPGGERHWAIGDFSNIIPLKSFDVKDGFSDENGVVNKEMPETDWRMSFEKNGNGTLVVVTLLAAGAQLQKLVEMGFEQGFKMALDNLDEEISRLKK